MSERCLFPQREELKKPFLNSPTYSSRVPKFKERKRREKKKGGEKGLNLIGEMQTFQSAEGETAEEKKQ